MSKEDWLRMNNLIEWPQPNTPRGRIQFSFFMRRPMAGPHEIGEVEHAEEGLMEAADGLAEAEEELAKEYLLYIAGGTPTWQAQKQAELKHGRAVTAARAHYEVALARIKRA